MGINCSQILCFITQSFAVDFDFSGNYSSEANTDSHHSIVTRGVGKFQGTETSSQVFSDLFG